MDNFSGNSSLKAALARVQSHRTSSTKGDAPEHAAPDREPSPAESDDRRGPDREPSPEGSAKPNGATADDRLTPLKRMLREYRSRGWKPVPIPRNTKAPNINGWQNRTFRDDEFTANIGVQLGAVSGGLTDVDLDCAEAVRIAPDFLAKTGAIFGRASKGKSHYLYRLTDTPPDKATIQFKDIDGAMLVELRLGGGKTGAQTVFPGSVHPSGERIEWSAKGDPAEIGFDGIDRRVRLLAVTAMLARHWPGRPDHPGGKPTTGGRHAAALVLGGFMARAGLNAEEAKRVMKGVVALTNDDQEADRLKCVEDAYEGHSKNENTYGLPQLKETLDDPKAAEQIAKWLGCSGNREAPASDFGGDEYKEELLRELNEQFFIVTYGGKTVVGSFEGERFKFMKREDFTLKYLNRHVGRQSLGEWWLKHPRRKQYEEAVFEPNQPKELPGNRVNLWRGWGVEERPGDWSLMKNHMLEVLADGDRECFEYLMNWSAKTVQDPATRIGVAVVLKSLIQGTGKGTFANALMRIFGSAAYAAAHHDDFLGTHNEHLQGRAFIFGDEAVWGGDKRSRGKLYQMITEPEITIHPKFVGRFPIENCLHFVFAGNAKWQVPAEANARRFFVLDVSTKHVDDTAYFDALYAQLVNGGYEAMLYELKNRDIGKFNPARFPRTKALIEQQRESLDDFDEWGLSLLDAGVLPGADRATPHKARSCDLYDHARRTVPSLKNESEKKLGDYLRDTLKCEPAKFDRGNCRGWAFKPLPVARRIFEEKRGGTWIWSDPDLTEWGATPSRASDRKVDSTFSERSEALALLLARR